MLASPASSSAGNKGNLVLRLLAVLVTLVLVDLALTVYVFVLSDDSGKLGAGAAKEKAPTVSTVIEVHKQIKSDSFTPYVATESSPAVMVKESLDIWLIFNTSEGASAQPLSGEGKAKGEPFSLPACDNGLAQPYEAFGGQIVCKGALGEKDYASAAGAKTGECAGEVIYQNPQVMVCAEPTANQAKMVRYLQKYKTIWETSLPGQPALSANSKSIWATRLTDKQGKISYQRFDVPGAPAAGSEKPAGWDAIKKVDFNNIDITNASGEPRKLTDGRFKSSPDPGRDIGLAVGIRQNDKVYADINGDGYLDFAQVLYLQTAGGEIPERDEGELTFQGRVHQILVWIWDPESQKPKLMEPKLIPPSYGPLCGGDDHFEALFAADLSAAEGYGLNVKYLFSEIGWSDMVSSGASDELLTTATRTEQAQYRVITSNVVRYQDGIYSAVVPAEGCINPIDSDDDPARVPDLLPFRNAQASLFFSAQDPKYRGYYWFAVWKDPQGNILWYALDESKEHYVLGWSK